jgi:N utilization substance protein A
MSAKINAKVEFNMFEEMKKLAEDKGIRPELLIEKIQAALVIAIKRDYPGSVNTQLNIDPQKGIFDVCILKEVVEDVEDPDNQITLSDAQKISTQYQLGDQCAIKLDPKQFGRIAAVTAKQVIKQGIKEAERSQLMEQWGDLHNEAVAAKVLKVETETGNAVVELSGNEVMLFKTEQIPGEIIETGSMIQVYVSGVSGTERRPTLKISRTHKDFVKRLLEREVPETADGLVEIKAVSREPGQRSKVAVASNDENIDAVGSCIGPQRSRITKVCEELRGEKIDVVLWSEDAAEFIKQALRPATVLDVDIPDPDKKECIATVPDNQLSLAIGNKGQNAKLAARLTGFKIDIKPQSGFYEG